MTTENILRELISFPVLGGESNLSIAQWIRDYIEQLDIEVHWAPNEDETKAAIHCRIGPAVDGGIILSGHTDVVPVKGQDWNTPPFEMTDDGRGKFFGRGTCDMKGFLACCLSVLPDIKAATLEKPFYLAFSYDEEIGCQGAPALIRHIGETYKEIPRYAIIGEPTLMQVVTGQKGICVLHTEVNGSAGHSSRIRQEVSAVHESARLIQWIDQKMNDLVEAGQLDERFDPPHTSLHVGQINGGIAPNVIADKATFYWDIRVIPGDTVPDILEEFNAFCKQREDELRPIFPDFKIRTTMFHSPVPPLDTDPNSSIVRMVQEAVGDHSSHTVAYAAEAGQFSEAGYESIICGPGSIAQAHRANEFIEKEQLNLGVEMLRKLISKFSKA